MAFPRTVLVTGANRGIGLEFVRQFVAGDRPPEHIFATHRADLGSASTKNLEDLAARHQNVHLLQLDVTDQAGIERVAQAVGRVVGDNGLNVLINNSGVLQREGIDGTTAELMMQHMAVNTVAPLMLTKALRPLIRQAAETNADIAIGWRRAAVVNITSQVGSIENNERGGIYAYRCSKTALNSLTKTQSRELINENIVSLLLHPGWVKTDMGTERALITTDVSVRGMMDILAKLDASMNGAFYRFDDKVVPW